MDSRSRLANICLVLLIFPFLSSAAAELNAFTESLPPLNYEENGVITGYATELLLATTQAAKIDTNISLLPWARAYQTVLAQPNTLIFSITRTPEREPVFEWIGPISSRQIFVYKLRERKEIQVKSMSDLAKYKVGLVREMASTKDFIKQSEIADDKIDFAPTVESNMKKLFMKRIDVIVSQDWSAAFLAKSLNRKPDELEAVLLLDKQHSYYFALNNQTDPALVAKLRLGYEAVQKSGQMDKLKNKYLH
ncbi:substrate-binding periplasmic protein [Undibacterium sp. Ren11W]|uniref:substrate-binding periplasmic protein n=1 Tax=Undibacterium sp. Ren11W TaxID=3413045 RepID=UPI003BF2B825